MSDSEFENGTHKNTEIVDTLSEFDDREILCIDCSLEFVWSAGEQAFFKTKGLENPPKRCKECKKAKNHRLEAIETAKLTGQRHKVEVRANCARCSVSTTVPFYPCQGRPVYCRACYAEMNAAISNSVNVANG